MRLKGKCGLFFFFKKERDYGWFGYHLKYLVEKDCFSNKEKNGDKCRKWMRSQCM